MTVEVSKVYSKIMSSARSNDPRPRLAIRIGDRISRNQSGIQLCTSESKTAYRSVGVRAVGG